MSQSLSGDGSGASFFSSYHLYINLRLTLAGEASIMDADMVALLLLAWDLEDLADLAGDLGGKWQLVTVSAGQTLILQMSARL